MLSSFFVDNNLFLVRRILARIPDIRNPDPGPSRYTSLAWSVLCVHEEIFMYLLESGHDDEDLSRVSFEELVWFLPQPPIHQAWQKQDSEDNTILCLLAGVHPNQPNPYSPTMSPQDTSTSLVRMLTAYHARFPFLLDWTNVRGKTPLHLASIVGNVAIAEVRAGLLPVSLPLIVNELHVRRCYVIVAPTST